MKLKYDHNINGNQFNAGENVDTNGTANDKDGKVIKFDYAEQLKASEKVMDDANQYANVHHGAVADTKESKGN